MKSKKGVTFVDLDDDDDDDKHKQMAAQSRTIPMKKKKKKKRPKPMLTFSSFARCSLLSLPKFTSTDFSSSSPHSNANSHNRNHKNIKEIDLSSDDDDYQDDDEEEEDQEEEETVQVDFEFFDPKPGDFHGVKLLLQRYLDNYQWDLSGFVDLILAQTTVGTVVKSADSEGERDTDDDSDGTREGGDEQELFAVITALNFGLYQDNQCIKELKQYLLGMCKEENTKMKLRQVLEEEAMDTGLLMCQRFANCPYQLVLKLYEALFDEISWATEDEPTAVLRDSFRFKHYFLITKILENKACPQQRAVKRKADLDEPVIYLKQEDEIFHEMSSWSFTFELSAEELAPPELKSYKKAGLAMIIKAEIIPKFLEKLKSLVESL